MDQKKTGAFLKSLRKEKGITQEELADRFSVSSRTVSRWETGSNMPDISMLTDIADFYDVDVREIIDGERKSEMMDEELRDVADKMADYADMEKSKLCKWVQVIGFTGVVVMTISIVLQCLRYEPDLRASGAIAASFVALLALAVTTFYANGVLSKLTKKKAFSTVIKVAVILLIVVSLKYILFMGIAVGVGIFDVVKPYTNENGVENYNKTEIVEKYSSDFGSYMLTFPDDVSNAEEADFESHLKYGILDTDGYVILTAKYNAEDYKAEEERLSKTQFEFHVSPSEVVVNDIRYDITTYNYPAYVASDGYGYVYEYALMDESENKITYVVISYPETISKKKYKDILKKDLDDYNNVSADNILNHFSIYQVYYGD